MLCRIGISIWQAIVGGTTAASLGDDSSGGTPTGDGTMDFSIATGDDTGLLVLLEDI